MTINVDLHSHSNQSDGVLTPVEVAQRAHANAVDVWSLTDHDEISGLKSARDKASGFGITFINGVEISATFCNRVIHVVGLGFDAEDKNLLETLGEIRDSRRKRAELIADRLTALEINDALAGAMRHIDNPRLIGRVHFAKHLVELGLCKGIQQAFDKYLGEGKQAFVPMQTISLQQTIDTIISAGGKAVLAHPGRYKFTRQQFGFLFDEFKDLGGHAIEVVTGSHSEAEYDKYARIALRYNFEASRGSDFHAPGAGRVDLGQVPPLHKILKPVWHDLI